MDSSEKVFSLKIYFGVCLHFTFYVKQNMSQLALWIKIVWQFYFSQSNKNAANILLCPFINEYYSIMVMVMLSTLATSLYRKIICIRSGTSKCFIYKLLSWLQGYPLHMNLALASQMHTARDEPSEAEHTIAMLKAQNKMLTKVCCLAAVKSSFFTPQPNFGWGVFS